MIIAKDNEDKKDHGVEIKVLGDFTDGLGNAIRSIKVSGNYLYAVTYVDDEEEAVFAVYDITNPVSPEKITNNLIIGIEGGAGKGS